MASLAAVATEQKDSLKESLTTYFSELGAYKVLTADQEVAAFQKVEAAETALICQMLSNKWFARGALKDLVSSVEDPGLEAAAQDALGAGQGAVVRAVRFTEPGREWYSRTYRAATDPAVMLKVGMGSAGFAKWKSTLEKLYAEQHSAKSFCVASNLRLVLTISKKYMKGSFLTPGDVIQEGNIGLMKAVERYDVSRGYRFSTYASWWIRANIKRAILDKDHVIRMPVHLADRIQQVARAEGKFILQHGRTPTLSELAKASNVSMEKVAAVLDARAHPRSVVPFDVPVGQDDLSFQDVTPDPDSVPADEQLHGVRRDAAIRRMLRCLTLQEQQIVRWRFGLDAEEKTLQEIGDIMGLSRERIRQIENRALSKMELQREAKDFRP